MIQSCTSTIREHNTDDNILSERDKTDWIGLDRSIAWDSNTELQGKIAVRQ